MARLAEATPRQTRGRIHGAVAKVERRLASGALALWRKRLIKLQSSCGCSVSFRKRAGAEKISEAPVFDRAAHVLRQNLVATNFLNVLVESCSRPRHRSITVQFRPPSAFSSCRAALHAALLWRTRFKHRVVSFQRDFKALLPRGAEVVCMHFRFLRSRTTIRMAVAVIVLLAAFSVYFAGMCATVAAQSSRTAFRFNARARSPLLCVCCDCCCVGVHEDCCAFVYVC